MQRAMWRSLALIILAVMLGGSVRELFDRWDDTPHRFLDYSAAAVVAASGLTFAVAHILSSSIPTPLPPDRRVADLSVSAIQPIMLESLAGESVSPPGLPLRI